MALALPKTLVLGASTNPHRASYQAAMRLKQAAIPFELLGLKKGSVAGVPIQDIRSKPDLNGIDTVTLYLGPQNQPEYYQYMLDLKPRRVIFNPGTENPEFVQRLEKEGIEADYACTLVLLGTGSYLD
jgi:predicted CoA-binding protein